VVSSIVTPCSGVAGYHFISLKWQGPPKRWYPAPKLHGVTT